MKKAITVASGSSLFCIDIDQIESLHTDSESTDEMLAKLKTTNEISGENGTGLQFISLSAVVDAQEDLSNRQQLIMLQHNDSGVGLLVSNIGNTFEVSDDAVLPLPKAFSRICHKCFPLVVVHERAAIPLLTAESVLSLGRIKQK